MREGETRAVRFPGKPFPLTSCNRLLPPWPSPSTGEGIRRSPSSTVRVPLSGAMCPSELLQQVVIQLARCGRLTMERP